MSTMTSELPVYREPVSQTTHRPVAVPERVGFWRRLWNTVRDSAIFVATWRVLDRVASWFTSGEAAATASAAGTWIAATASSFWNWTTGLFRRTPAAVTRTVAAPAYWVTWAGLWTITAAVGLVFMVANGVNWLMDRYEDRVVAPLGRARYYQTPPADFDPMVEPRMASATPAEKVTITVKGASVTLPEAFDPGDMDNPHYNWKRYFQVDNEQQLADLVYGNDAKVSDLLNRIEQIDQNLDRVNALRCVVVFTQVVDFNAPHNHEFLSNWYGRLDCYAEFVSEGAAAFFNTDEDEGVVMSLQERAEYHANRMLAQRKNKNPKFSWFHKPGYLKGFITQGKALEATHVVAGSVA